MLKFNSLNSNEEKIFFVKNFYINNKENWIEKNIETFLKYRIFVEIPYELFFGNIKKAEILLLSNNPKLSIPNSFCW